MILLPKGFTIFTSVHKTAGQLYRRKIHGQLLNNKSSPKVYQICDYDVLGAIKVF